MFAIWILNTGNAGAVQGYSAYGAPLVNSQPASADFSQSGTATGADLLSKAFTGIQQFAGKSLALAIFLQ